MKPSEAIEKFNYELKRRNRTTKNYVNCMRAMFTYSKSIRLNGEEQKELYLNLSSSWVSHLQEIDSSEKTINLHIAAIKKFSTLVLGYNIKNDELPRLKEPKKLPEPLSTQEIHKIFAGENNRKHLLMLQVAYYGGLRLSDIRMLKVKNLRYDRGIIHIEFGKGMKDRIVPFPDIIHSTMREYTINKNQDDYIFTSQLTGNKYPKRTIQKIFENACKRANIQGKMNTHRFRHSFGSHMVQKGVNLRIIQEMMGHSSSKTTEIYTRIAATDIAAVRNVLAIEN